MSSLFKRKLIRKEDPDAFTYVLKFRDERGVSRSKSLMTESFEIAKKAQQLLDARLALRKLGLEKPFSNLRLDKFWTEHKTYSINTKSYGTVVREVASYKNFRKFTGNILLIEITPQLIERYKAERAACVKPVTVNIELRHLSAVFTMAVDWGYLNENPFRRVKKMKIPDDGLSKSLTKEEVERFLSVIDNKRDETLFYAYLTTGGRRMEVLGLKWTDIDFESDLLVFRRRKNGRATLMPLHPGLRKKLLDLPPEGERVFPLSGSHVSRRFKMYLLKAGLPGHFTLHSLRHTFVTLGLESTGDLSAFKNLAGHSSISTTQIYTHLSMDHLRGVVSKLPY